MKAPKAELATESFDMSEERRDILDYFEKTKENFFLTGKAGTGKSHLLSYFRKNTQKKIVVLAPTGVAALNVQGQTIHSFFGFGASITPRGVRRVQDQSLYKNLDTIVIDEISMVRADLLDCVDKFLRLNGPQKNTLFGGVQMIFIGDLFQLPPVVTPGQRHLFETVYKGPYFFNAKAFQKGFYFRYFELQKNYRQSEQAFMSLLDAIRLRLHSKEDLQALNERYRADTVKIEDAIHLVTTREMANNVNIRKLAEVKTEDFISDAGIQGDWSDDGEKETFPTQKQLMLRVGAQVMLLNNDAEKRWVNGDIGKILSINEKDALPLLDIQLADGRKVSVGKYQWNKAQYVFMEDTQEIKSEIVGTFTQYPLCLAWAITIHKSQGKTFDKAVIDFGTGTFAHGQAYVALSRCRTFEGILLRQKVMDKDIRVDSKIKEFYTLLNTQVIPEQGELSYDFAPENADSGSL